MTDLADRVPMTPASAPTLVEGIQSALRTAITTGSLPSGFRLREIALAKHFGCSTTPVREAIRKLEDEGLVKIYPRRGAEVTKFTNSEVDQLYETRRVLETYAIRKAAQQKPDFSALAPLRELLARQERLIAEDGRDAELVDAEIHEQFAVLSGNPVMAQLIARATRQIEAVQSRTQTWVEGGMRMALVAHKEIIEAVEKGDPDAAEDRMRRHLDQAEKAVAAALKDPKSN